MNLDSIWSFLFGVPSYKSSSGITNKVEICPDAVLVILAMIRTMLNQVSFWSRFSFGYSKINYQMEFVIILFFQPVDDSVQWLKEYPVTLIQFFLYLYHNTPEFVPICMSGDVLCGLASTLFIYKSSSENNSEVVSPVDDFRVIRV